MPDETGPTADTATDVPKPELPDKAPLRPAPAGPGATPRGEAARLARTAREAAALRNNLRRRKDQARTRAATSDAATSDAATPPPKER